MPHLFSSHFLLSFLISSFRLLLFCPQNTGLKQIRLSECEQRNKAKPNIPAAIVCVFNVNETIKDKD